MTVIAEAVLVLEGATLFSPAPLVSVGHVIQDVRVAALEVIVGVVGALGGAAITALGAALVQRSGRRSAERKEFLDRQAQTRTQALETTAAARTASRSCALFLGHVIQDLEAGRPIDISLFDTTLRELLTEVNTGFFRMVATEAELVDTRPLASARTSLTETSTLIRRVLLQKEAGQSLDRSPSELADLVERAAADLNLLMHTQAVHLRGSATPEIFGGGQAYPGQPASPMPHVYPYPSAEALEDTMTPRVYPAPSAPRPAASEDAETTSPLPELSSGSSNPFWFAVPTSRRLSVDIGAPAVLEPGVWYLALSRWGNALEVQIQNGPRGILYDTSGIQRA
ncbi:hypothetical protein GCM10010275_36830 [Streptomyces litmocidini]|uniref:hypothetical protein n=1 Tax=Streptomyces litmocidini TaxID=67318 RepID=UPI00167E2438|nr:hypothetical protein [Streptomyces litmocidini]GGU95542.1 hypothetical protein GCM10010275_36830 [Streptomyces litmocidini]